MILDVMVLTSMQIGLVYWVSIGVTLNLISLDLGLVRVESALVTIVVLIVHGRQKGVSGSFIYPVRMRLSWLLFTRAQTVMEQRQGDVRSALVVCSMDTRQVLLRKGSPWWLMHFDGSAVPCIRHPLIFNRSIVDALTNGSKSLVIQLGLFVPKKRGTGFKTLTKGRRTHTPVELKGR